MDPFNTHKTMKGHRKATEAGRKAGFSDSCMGWTFFIGIAVLIVICICLSPIGI